MLDELTPEQFAEHIAAEEVEPTGDELLIRLEAYRLAFEINLHGSRKEGQEPMKPETLLPHLRHFLSTGKSDVQTPATPSEAMKLLKGRA